jgi:hypothetical protein
MIRALDRVFAVLAGAGTASLIVAIGMVALDVVIRKMLQRSLIGTVDVTELVVMIAAFTALPLVFLRKAQVSVEIVTDLMPRRWRAFFEGLGAVRRRVVCRDRLARVPARAALDHGWRRLAGSRDPAVLVLDSDDRRMLSRRIRSTGDGDRAFP